MSTKPTVGELEIQLKNLVRNWESFARQLPGLEESALEKIKYNKRHGDVDSQKAALYGKWLEVCPNASWDDVTAALHKAEENTIAKHVQEWLSSVDRQMSLSPKQPQAIEVPEVHPSSTDVNTSIQQEYEVPESIVDELEDLHETFVPLAMEVKSQLQEAVDNGKVPVQKLASYVQERSVDRSCCRSRDVPHVRSKNAEQILQSVQHQYTFLSPNFLLNMASFFLVSYPITKQAAEDYKSRIAVFKKKVTVRSLKNELGRFNKHLRKSSNNLVLKILVTNAWGEQSIFLVETLLLTLFPIVDPDELPWYSVCAGSLLLSFIASNHMILPLIVSCARKMEVMRHLGIISVTIGNILIRVNDEAGLAADDVHSSFLFEDCLIQATASDQIEVVCFLLKYFHINVNATHTKKSFLQKFYYKQSRYPTKDTTLEELYMHINQLKIIRDKIEQYNITKSKVNPSNRSDEPDINKFLKEIEYHVLNTTLIRNQLSHLPDTFKKKFTNLCIFIEGHKNFTKIRYFQDFLKSVPALNYTTQVTITLSKVWSECSAERIETVIKFLFPRTPIEKFYWFRVKELKKTLKIKLLISPKPGQFIFNHFLAKILGVIEVRLNDNDIIFKSEENKDGYTFKKRIQEAEGIDKIVTFLRDVIEFPFQFINKPKAKPDHNNNTQMIPEPDSTPLIIACCNSNSQLVQLLLEHGADPNITTDNLKRALYFCTNNSKIFQMLLDHGAEIDDETKHTERKFQETVLHNACITNNVKVVDILLNNKYPHINTQDLVGNTALWRACSRGYTDIVERLLKGKADASIPNDAGETPLVASAEAVHLPIVEILLKAKMDPNIKDDIEGKAPLLIASSKGHKAMVECLLHAQADPNISDNIGVTPLILASCDGHVAVVECLLHVQADPNIRDNNGITPLWMASQNGHVAVVKRLLHAQADPNIPDNNGITPLWVASVEGHEAVVECLLCAQADPNIRNKNLVTPLWAASCEGHKRAVRCLLHAQADPNIPDNRGITPLQMAFMKGHICTSSILFNHILANCDSHEDKLAWIATAKRQLSVDAVHLLLRAQADPSILELGHHWNNSVNIN